MNEEAATKQSRALLLSGFIVLVYLVLSMLFSSAFFSWSDLDSHAIQGGDAALNAWVLQRVSHQLTANPMQLLDGNAYHPEPNTLTNWDHMASLALINVILRPFSDSPWFGYNLLIFLAYFISCLGGYRLAMTLTGNRFCSFWAGLFWGFLFFRAHHFSHLQILSFQWIPFCLESLISFLKTENTKHLARFVLFTLLQSLVGWYLAVINGFLLMVAFVFLVGKKNLKPSFFRKSLAAGLAFITIMLPFILAYSRTNQSSRVIEERSAEIQSSGEQVLIGDYLHPPLSTIQGQIFKNRRYSIWGEQTLYIGLVPLILSFTGLWYSFRRRRKWGNITSIRLALLAVSLIIVGGVFALGHNSHTLGIPLPWHFVCKVIPYFGIIRATPRFSLLVYMGILLLSSVGLFYLLSRVGSQKKKLLITSLLSIFFLVEVYPFHLPFRTAKAFQYEKADLRIAEIQRETGREMVMIHMLPKITSKDRMLLREGQTEVLFSQMPRELRTMRQKQLPRFLLGSTAHWSRLMGGTSQLRHQTLQYNVILSFFPDNRALALLRLYNVDLVAFYDNPEVFNKNQFEEMLETANRIGRVFRLADGNYLLKIDRDALDQVLSEGSEGSP